MKNLILYVFICLAIFSNVAGANNLQINIYIEGKAQTPSFTESIHIYGNTVSYLSTCNQLEKVTQKKYSTQVRRQALTKLKEHSYINILAKKDSLTLPIAHKNQNLDNIFIGFSASNMPHVITTYNNEIQLYAKCMGHIAVSNFTCDKSVAKLFGFDINKQLCESFE